VPRRSPNAAQAWLAGTLVGFEEGRIREREHGPPQRTSDQGGMLSFP